MTDNRKLETIASGLLFLAAGLAIVTGARPASAQDFRVLEEKGVTNPEANRAPLLTPPSVLRTRVLLAGDSWAQYMWDDGSHNDLFDRFGQADKRALSQSLSSDPGPGYLGPEYAISGSEARQWVDTANYPWISNLVYALETNPTADVVLLSIGGNDILAGKSGGGWYKDMDLDHAGSEAALFDRIHDDTSTILDAALAVRPEVRVVLSSYDYPNFNVGFWCFLYACPKRRDLSRDPTNDLITDQELNQLMIDVETRRIAWTNAIDRFDFDHAIGLMHYWYGDGVAAPLTLPYPGQAPPAYLPFPGGNPARPTLRACFRQPNGIDADPIHLNYAGYQYKIANQTATTFFPLFRGNVTATFASEGGLTDGWTDGVSFGTSRIRVGATTSGACAGILSFDTSGLPDGALVTGASLYLVRESLSGTNPFTSGALGEPRIDVVSGTFGAPPVEASDATAPAGAVGAGYVVGSAKANGYAIRLEVTGAGLSAINPAGRTQFRLTFPAAPAGATNWVAFLDGEAPLPAPASFPSLATYMGSAAPFLDVTYELPAGVPDPLVATGSGLRSASPNPFRYATSLRFRLAGEETVRLDIFDVRGRLVRRLSDERFPGGNHSLTWDGRDDAGSSLSSGVYLARLAAGGTTSSLRLIHVKE